MTRLGTLAVVAATFSVPSLRRFFSSPTASS